MNNNQKLIQRNEFKNLLDINSTKYRNAVKYWKGISKEHFLVMSEICFKLVEDYEMDFYTEAIFNKKGRADIFAFNHQIAVIIEILNSEKESNIEKKEEYYPDLPIIRINVKDFNMEEFKI